MAVSDRAHLDILVAELPSALVGAWPGAAARRLAGVLARAAEQTAPAGDYEHDLLRVCGMASGSESACSPPLAAICAAADLGLAVDAIPSALVRADPVHLRADPARLVLFDATTIGLDEGEADALIAHLNAAFADDGLRFRRGAAPTRWYVELPHCPQVPGASPNRLRGVPLSADAAARRAHSGLERLLTEIQMVLHDCPPNAARAAAGLAPVNSLWPWGAGPLPKPSHGFLSVLVSTDFLARACAAHAGIPVEDSLTRLPAVLNAAHDRLAVVCAPDTDQALPECFVPAVLEPALAALQGGRLAGITVHCAEHRYVLDRWSRWRVWRKGEILLDRLRAAHGAGK
ncbi:MAG: hypothetical protein WD928_13095 [Gammaproteobacteria bacterium]